MGVRQRLRRVLTVGAQVTPAGRCRADWRRPEGYWRCTRKRGHAGRHRMRAGKREAELAPPMAPSIATFWRAAA